MVHDEWRRLAVRFSGRGRGRTGRRRIRAPARGQKVQRVFGQVIGALMRALLMGLMVTLPASLLPDTRPDSAQIVVLFALFVGVLTLVEYASRYPGLVEFRYAPPYNRLRFAALALSVLLLSLMWRGEAAPSTVGQFLAALGGMLGNLLDFPYSPVRLLMLTLPASTPAGDVALLRAAAGLSATVALGMLMAFGLMLWLSAWPARTSAFNVWVNLPTFDPTAGGDVVARLERDARTNIVLGALFPFVAPALLLGAGSLMVPLPEAGTQTQIWVIAAWGFLPAGLVMRGVALARVARMIRERREAAGAEARLQPV